MTRIDWVAHAPNLREHAAADAVARTADTGQIHRPDQDVLSVVSLCDSAVCSPDRPNTRLEGLVADTLVMRPAPRPHTGNFDLSSRPGHRPSAPRR